MSAEDEEVDIPALVEELRRDAHELRAKLGPTVLPPLEPPADALAAVARETAGDSDPFAVSPAGDRLATELQSLRALADPAGAEIQSHRATAGRAVVAAKKLLRRLLTPILERQAAYNRTAIDALSGVDAALRENATGYRRLGRRLDAMERALASLPAAAEAGAARIDYLDFENAFRGDSAHVRTMLARYLQYFPGPDAGPVLDLGCGRGEFLDLLAERGVTASGVDQDGDMVAACRGRGLDVRLCGLIAALEATPDASLGGVVSFQVVEHLPLVELLQMIVLAHQKVRPGGCFIAETVNPESVITFTRAWSIDPTHRHPLHPLTLRFLVERAGFARSELVYGGEVEPHVLLEGAGDDDAAARNVARLNRFLFGAQDYAVVAFA
jgi:O-antigen chain-terminating methyltransferase